MGLFSKEDERDRQREQGWRIWIQERDPLALASFVVGVFSLSHLGTLLLDGVAAVVLGVLAIGRINSSNPKWQKGVAIAWIGMLCAAVSLFIGISMYLKLPWITRLGM